MGQSPVHSDASGRDRKVYLIGFSATGKSHSGRLAAQELGADFVDMDRLIVRREGKQISEIFEAAGEDEFRRIERELLRELADEPGQQVISTGGGVPVDARNRDVMAESGLTIRLMASPETIYARINRTGSRTPRRTCRQGAVRPMLAASESEETSIEAIQSLLVDREEAYAAAADVAIDTEGREPPDVASEIVARIGQSASDMSKITPGKTEDTQ
jgi:shikimate kinase|tara:strand:- start:924 stop:1571 length:648 start_codon:yes stop_codon:yes gene_type:complete